MSLVGLAYGEFGYHCILCDRELERAAVAAMGALRQTQEVGFLCATCYLIFPGPSVSVDLNKTDAAAYALMFLQEELAKEGAV